MADINFGILDTQMPGRIAAIPQQQQAQQAQNAMQLMQVQQTMQQNALAKAKMEEYTRGAAEKNALRGRMTQPGFNIYDPAHQADIMALSPELAPGLIKHALDVETAKSTTGKNLAQTEAARLAAIKTENEFINDFKRSVAINPSNANIIAFGEDAVLRGIFSPEKVKQVTERMLATPLEERPAMFARAGAPAAAPVTPTELSKYVSERAAMLPGDPRIANWDAKIAELSTAPAAQRAITNQHAAERNQIARTRLVNETATGKFTPDTVDFLAQTYIQTGNIPPLGMGRAAADLRQKVIERAAIMARTPATAAPGEAAPAPVSAADAARIIGQNKQAFAGGTAGQRTLGTTLANVTSAATEANNMIPLVEKYAALVNPTDFPLVNAAGNFVSRQGGGENVVGLAGSLNSLVNAYARAINPKGVATVSDKNHAREIINEAMSKGQLNTALSVMRAEMESAMAAPVQVQERMRGGGKSQAPAAAATTPKAAPASGAIQDGYRFKGGDPAKASNWEKVGG